MCAFWMAEMYSKCSIASCTIVYVCMYVCTHTMCVCDGHPSFALACMCVTASLSLHQRVHVYLCVYHFSLNQHVGLSVCVIFSLNQRVYMCFCVCIILYLEGKMAPVCMAGRSPSPLCPCFYPRHCFRLLLLDFCIILIHT